MKIRNLYQQPPETARHGTLKVWKLLQKEDFQSHLDYIVECLLEAGVTIEPHEHADMEEVYYILNGIGEMRLGEETQEVREGDTIYVPPRVTHTMKNVGGHPLCFLCVGADISSKGI